MKKLTNTQKYQIINDIQLLINQKHNEEFKYVKITPQYIEQKEKYLNKINEFSDEFKEYLFSDNVENSIEKFLEYYIFKTNYVNKSYSDISRQVEYEIINESFQNVEELINNVINKLINNNSI